MSIPHLARCRYLAPSLLFLTLTSTALAHGPAPDASKAQTAVATQPAAVVPESSDNQHSYPQIVRISLLQRDVRIARGKKDAVWEKATTDLPLETGFNLVTGNDGRVEIEFEDASTVYLGENSALGFNDLSTTGGVPRTDLTLLAGTLSVRLQPTMPQEWYVVRTPTDHFAIQYPNLPFARINSYLDAMKVTAESDTTFHLQSVLGKPQGRDRYVSLRASGKRDRFGGGCEDVCGLG
jgi:FecR protein